MSSARVQINPGRLKYLLQLFALTVPELLARASEGLAKPLTEQDIFAEQIKQTTLKRIDRVFNKGLFFYTDPAPPPAQKTASIFFRKQTFNAELTFGDRALIHQMEGELHYLSALCALSNVNLKRKLPAFSQGASPAAAARQMRKIVYPENFRGDDKAFLVRLIDSCAGQNILVKEYVETWNKKDKTALNGMFIAPHLILIKRNQRALRREIFTLAHELGHYLLNKEEVDTTLNVASGNLARTEKWCNSFAFHFLTGGEGIEGEELRSKTLVKQFCDKHHISRLALYTQLAIAGEIPWGRYHKLKKALEEEYEENARQRKAEQEELKALNDSLGIKTAGASPKPIYSALEKNIYASAYAEGVIEAVDIIEKFKLRVKKSEKGLNESYADTFLLDSFLNGRQHEVSD